MTNLDLKFGTSGLRGLVETLDGGPAVAFACAFARVMIDQGRLAQGGAVLIGRDLRKSSPSIAQYCCTGLHVAGTRPVDCGELPTPALAHRALTLGVPAIMVTGSHIPDDRNGLKFYRPDGEIDRHDEAAITEAATPDDLPVSRSEPARSDTQALSGYVDRATRMLEPGAFAGMKIGVYQHSSVARDMLVEVLGALGAEPVAFARSDVFVPIDTEALGAKDAELCRAAVDEYELDAVVSTDGDADRPLVADEAGDFLRGDLLGAVTAEVLGTDCIVTPVTSNTGIERCGLFRRVIRTRIGSPNVIEGMSRGAGEGASTVVGFEANGGVLVGSDASIVGRRLSALPTRDALVPILAALWAAKSGGIPLSGLAARYGFCAAATGLLRGIDASDSAPFLARLLDDHGFRYRFTGGLLRVLALDSTDGVRLKGEDGRVLHYRASGNAPELRCYVEAESNESARKLVKAGLARADEYLTGTAPK